MTEEAHETIVVGAYHSFRGETLGIKGSGRKEMMGDDILLMFRGPINACKMMIKTTILPSLHKKKYNSCTASYCSECLIDPL